MPGGYLEPPTAKCAPEGADLDGLCRVDHVLGQAVDEAKGEFRVVVDIELADGLLRVPSGRHLSFRVTGTQQPEELGPSLYFQAFVGFGKQSATAIEGIGLAAPVSRSGPAGGIRRAFRWRA
jgi:hypothetical protein